MMPIRDPDTISITSAPEAPPPKIRILDAFSKEVETVRIGDRLTFRIEIPNNSSWLLYHALINICFVSFCPTDYFYTTFKL